MQYRQAYEFGKTELEKADIIEASLDARLLLEYVCHTDRSFLYAHGEDEISPIQWDMYEFLVKKRASRIPLQHITGEQEFMGMTFKVNENVLIPRQDTEILVEEAMLHIDDGAKLLDMCTGSGCVLISVARFKNDLYTVGADISDKALDVARQNADLLLTTDNCNKPIFINTDLFENIDEKFDVITSNPPYIETGVIDTLSEEVKSHDPILALDGGEDGLDIIRRLVCEAKQYLNKEGWLLIEIGYNQGKACADLFKENGYVDVEIKKDYSGNDRVVLARLG